VLIQRKGSQLTGENGKLGDDDLDQDQAIEELLMTTSLGVGTCPAHHGEIVQGMFYADDGSNVRGLVTLPCHLFSTTAKFLPTPQPDLLVFPSKRAKRKAARAAELTLTYLGKSEQGGLLFLGSDSPEGWGLGSSTSDVVATIRAVANAFHKIIPDNVVADISVRAEVASDSLMFSDDAVLFAHRDGFVIEVFDKALPPLLVLGFDTDPTHTGVDTLLHPPASYSWEQIESFRPLRGLLKRGISEQDPRMIGSVATASAKINQQFLPKPRFPDLLQLAEQVGAVGIQVAHSGSVVGILFDANDSATRRSMARAVSALRRLGFPACHRFPVGAL